MENKKELWKKILKIVKEELSSQAYNSWFSQTKIIEFSKNSLIISAPGDFCKDWLEKHYTGFIKDILKMIIGSDDNFKIEFRTAEQKYSVPAHSILNPKKKTKNVGFPLNPKYTFDNFVVGNSNCFAHAACLAVAQSPAKAYNPLFVYGGVGLGRDHLIQAICNYIIDLKLRRYLENEKINNSFKFNNRNDSKC